MVMGDHHDIAPASQVLSVVGQQIVPASSGKPAAMHVHQDGPLACGGRQAGSPDVQPQAVLAGRRIVGAIEKVGVLVGMRRIVAGLIPGVAGGGAHVPVMHRTAHTGPGRRLGRSLETRRPAGGRAVRDTLEGVHPVHGVAAYFSRGGLGDRLRLAGGRRLAFRGLRTGDARRQNRHALEQSATRRPHPAGVGAGRHFRRIVDVPVHIHNIDSTYHSAISLPTGRCRGWLGRQPYAVHFDNGVGVLFTGLGRGVHVAHLRQRSTWKGAGGGVATSNTAEQ
jgi:hypothetical protein